MNNQSSKRKSSINRSPVKSLNELGINSELDVVRAYEEILKGTSKFSSSERRMVMVAFYELANILMAERVRMSKQPCERIRVFRLRLAKRIKSIFKKKS